MAEKKYKLLSPGIILNEIDNSQIPRTPNQMGPVVIGRASRGPSMVPVKVDSMSEFVEVFGNPHPGGEGGDIWRDGNKTAPLYGAYAAQAWLTNNTPLTYVRLLGTQHSDATAAGAAGWQTSDSSGNFNGIGTLDSAGGAYGLFLINSSSNGVLSASAGAVGQDSTPATGTLAAIWYINEGSITLSGTLCDNAQTISGTSVLVESVGSDKEFRAIVRDTNSNIVKTTTFNFNRNSSKYIRKVFNTNPTLTNSDISQGANTASYWLGETFERDVDQYVTNNSAGQVFGLILGLKGNSGTKEGSDFRFASKPSSTGWFFCQDLQIVSGTANTYQPENMTKLFRFKCLDTGESTQTHVKISIQDIKASSNQFETFGSFTVAIRKIDDVDNAPVILERFTNCNLNPYSTNYIAKRVGDKYRTWDDTERRYIELGNYDNQSKFIRVEMNSDVDAGAINSELLPFGVFGPQRFLGFTLISGSTGAQNQGVSVIGSNFSAAFVQGAQNVVRSATLSTSFIRTGQLMFSGSFNFPSMQLRTSSMSGDLANPKNAYFGLDTSIASGNNRFDPGYKDLVRALPFAYSATDGIVAGETQYSWIFTLDDLWATGSSHMVYVSGSRASGISVTAQGSDNYKAILDEGFNRFTSPLFGGFDGLDITEKEPFNNTDIEGATETTSYAYNSIKRAIDVCSDPEVVEFNLATVPGITNESLTSHLLEVCTNRGDALALIDLKGGFIPSTENALGDSNTSNRGDVDTTISNLKARGINNSYGCAYYPWVQAFDTITGATLWVPSSIVALGTMGSSESKSELWFASAGFNRGGLSEGAAGIPVVGVREKLTTKQRDKLYEANINPIASFPSEGIVVFGQKTLQVTPSALDRINVRRLLIYIKKEIARISQRVLFDQNTKVTWNRFLGEAEPLLRSIRSRLGLEDYKLILDETTTTPEMIDRNIMYAKILLKPTKSIEWVIVDFNIDSQGASFVD